MLGIGYAELLVILVAWGIPGLIGAALARSKGRSTIGWFLVSAFFWIPIIVIAILPPAKEIEGKYRQCPACKEFVKWDATICKHCRNELYAHNTA